MADTVVITGVRRYEGEYELDLVGEPLTTLEWRWIKKIGGYLPVTVDAGWVGRDPDLFLALAIIGLYRAGKIEKDQAHTVAELLADAPTSAIRIVGEAQEEEGEKDGDADDPPEVPSESEPSKPDGGEPSSQTSDQPDPIQPPTGRPGLLKSVTSDLETLAS